MHPAAAIKSVSSWGEFRTVVRQLPNTKAKGDAFEHVCLGFLRTDPRYVSDLKTVWLRKHVPTAIAKRLNLPDTDEGIDGIAETRDGEFWAFQCKYLDDPSHALTKNALDGFSHLALTHCKGIAKALVLHTSCAPIRKHRLLGISEVGLREFEGLEKEDWQSILHALRPNGSARKSSPRKPHPHQVTAVKAITKHFRAHDRGRVLMACGTGKSLVGFWVQQALRARQVVVAVPSLSLLNQTLKEWANEWVAHGETVRYTAVCSDESAAALGSSDSFVAHAYELGIDTYTDVKHIAERLQALRHDHHVIFTTYQSSHRLAAAARRARITFDLGILDEAHKTVGQRGDRFTTLLDAKLIRIRKRMSMTATERVLKGSDDRVLSMDDPKVYGEVAFSYTFKQAIADGVICDYKVVTLAVSESWMRELIAKNLRLRLHRKGNADRLRLARDLAAGELLAKAQTEYGVRHAISFHRNISAASGFAEQWETVGGLVGRRIRSTAFHVSSKVPTGRRVELLQEFRQAPSAVVTNARCLTEGVDVPNVDAVLFADPRQSRIDIVQAVGRALRKNRDKPDKTAYVLLPVLVQDGQTLEDFLDSTAFAEIGRVLAVLSTHDEQIAEEFRVSEGTGDGVPRDPRIVFIGDVPAGVRVSAAEFSRKCRARAWERIGRLNWRSFEEARDWTRKQHLNGISDWKKLCAGSLPNKPHKPPDIPSNPNLTYRDLGWQGFGDWFGTGRIANQHRKFRSFEQARAWVQQLGLAGFDQWWQYCAGRLSSLPSKPIDIPSTPSLVYKHSGWVSWGHWLGKRNQRKKGLPYRSFAEARRWVHELNLRSYNEWRRYRAGLLTERPSKPEDIPGDPYRIYRDSGWAGWGDWLGSGSIANFNREFRSFTEARAWAQTLGIRDSIGWKDFCAGRLDHPSRKPDDIPACPNVVYKTSGWVSWADWCGSMNQWRSFSEARAWAHELRLQRKADWTAYCDGQLSAKMCLPIDIPRNPASTYRNQGWIGWRDWLGISRRIKWRSFDEARAFARELGLRGTTAWRDYCTQRTVRKPPKPDDVPTNPNVAYKDFGWSGWGDWLGTSRSPVRNRRKASQRRIFLPFEEARAWVHKLGLESQRDWASCCKGALETAIEFPNNIPKSPDRTYKDSGWKGWGDWLGNGRKANQCRVFLPFEEARAWVHKLGLESQHDWQAFCNGRLEGKPSRPDNIPTAPQRTYVSAGWVSWGDWLGTGRSLRMYNFLPFAKARAWVHKLGLTSAEQWVAYCAGRLCHKPKKPERLIPSAPNTVYKDTGWNGWSDWLGSPPRRRSHPR